MSETNTISETCNIFETFTICETVDHIWDVYDIYSMFVDDADVLFSSSKY
jgi:hypothetical protein